jgi:hypothetical protein
VWRVAGWRQLRTAVGALHALLFAKKRVRATSSGIGRNASTMALLAVVDEAAARGSGTAVLPAGLFADQAMVGEARGTVALAARTSIAQRGAVNP